MSDLHRSCARRASRTITVSKDEEEQLVAGFKEAMAVADLATLHGRTMRAIEARLERLGLLKASDRTTSGGWTTPIKKGKNK